MMFAPPHMVMLCSPCGDMIVHLHLILYHCLSWCKRSSVMNIGSYQVFFRPWFQKVTKLFCPHVHFWPKVKVWFKLPQKNVRFDKHKSPSNDGISLRQFVLRQLSLICPQKTFLQQRTTVSRTIKS